MPRMTKKMDEIIKENNLIMDGFNFKNRNDVYSISSNSKAIVEFNRLFNLDDFFYKAKTPRHYGSYGLKHFFEKALSCHYMSNGEFILCALYQGHRFKQYNLNGMMYFQKKLKIRGFVKYALDIISYLPPEMNNIIKEYTDEKDYKKLIFKLKTDHQYFVKIFDDIKKNNT